MIHCALCALDKDRPVGSVATQHRHGFVDSETGREFCHEHLLALVTWELDGCPDPDDYPDLVEVSASFTDQEQPAP